MKKDPVDIEANNEALKAYNFFFGLSIILKIMLNPNFCFKKLDRVCN